MSTVASSSPTRGFVPVSGFIETAVARRLQSAVEDAVRLRSHVVVMSLPGEGKTDYFLHLLDQHPVTKQSGIVRTDILGCRRPHSGSDRNALMYMLGARLGRILRMAPSEYLTSLIGLAQGAGITLVVIDDAHELNRTQRAWLREFAELLKQPVRPELAPARVALVYLASGLPTGRPTTPLFAHGPMTPDKDGRLRIDLDWVQFERRLNGDPIVWVDGLDLPETGEALNGFTSLYRPQFDDLDLAPFAEDLHAGLTHPTVDYARTGRVRMDSLVKVLFTALDKEAAAGGTGSPASLAPRLAAAVELLKARPDLFDNLQFGRTDAAV